MDRIQREGGAFQGQSRWQAFSPNCSRWGAALQQELGERAIETSSLVLAHMAGYTGGVRGVSSKGDVSIYNHAAIMLARNTRVRTFTYSWIRLIASGFFPRAGRNGSRKAAEEITANGSKNSESAAKNPGDQRRQNPSSGLTAKVVSGDRVAHPGLPLAYFVRLNFSTRIFSRIVHDGRTFLLDHRPVCPAGKPSRHRKTVTLARTASTKTS